MFEFSITKHYGLWERLPSCDPLISHKEGSLGTLTPKSHFSKDVFDQTGYILRPNHQCYDKSDR